MADVNTVVPYVALLGDNIENRDEQTRGFMSGVYASRGNLGYLAELGYSNLVKSFGAGENLVQNDFYLSYAKYETKYMYKLGFHAIDTNEVLLGSGTTLVGALGSYKYEWYDKYSYGSEFYYSMYKSGLTQLQVTPYFSYFNSISASSSNFTLVKMNYIVELDFVSMEMSNTFYYRSVFATLEGYFGKMRTTLRDGGLSVYNSLDLMKNGYGVKMGYYLNKNITLSASASFHTVAVYEEEVDTTNRVLAATLSYSF